MMVYRFYAKKLVFVNSIFFCENGYTTTIITTITTIHNSRYNWWITILYGWFFFVHLNKPKTKQKTRFFPISDLYPIGIEFHSIFRSRNKVWKSSMNLNLATTKKSLSTFKVIWDQRVHLSNSNWILQNKTSWTQRENWIMITYHHQCICETHFYNNHYPFFCRFFCNEWWKSFRLQLYREEFFYFFISFFLETFTPLLYGKCLCGYYQPKLEWMNEWMADWLTGRKR